MTIFLSSYIITLVITPVVRKLAFSNGFINEICGDPLKIHKKPIALLGGLAVAIATVFGILVWSWEPWVGSLELGVGSYSTLKHILIGGILILSIGLWDDIKKVKPIVRLLAQVLAGVIILLSGIKVNFMPIKWIAVPFTLFYVAGAINALNVIDGMDGLCVGVSLVSCFGFFFLGIKGGNELLLILSAVLFMSLLGFLPYNFHPARIFLGNAGSNFLGFMLGTMAVIATDKPYNIAGFIAPILIVGMPVFDMAIAILRRAIRKKPLFMGDRDHIYDLLLKKGWSQPKVWSIVVGVQFLLVLIVLNII